MKTVQIIKTVLTAVILVWIVGGCSSKEIQQETIETESAKEVSYKAPIEATSYRWRQLSGIEVHIDDPSSRILRFSAPKVSKKERLRFELEARHDERNIERMLLSVIVSASPSDTVEDNATSDTNTTGGDDGNATVGETDDNTTTDANNDANTTGGGGSDDNTTIGSGDDDNSTADGTDDNATTGGGDDNTTTTPTATLTSLNLTVDKTSLNKDENTTIKVIATYSDNSTKEMTDNIEWLITPKDAVAIKGNTLTALKDVNVTLQAKVGNTLSNKVTLDIYWEVNGHRLPPEPDPKINNATLLGVDSNNNRVRDDVERWIYEEYKDKHPIYIDIAMQAARGYRLVLEKQPKTKEEAKEITEKVDSVVTCEGYYMVYAKYFNEPLLLKERIDNVVEYKYYNTDERKTTYLEYDKLLSGDTYPTAKIDINMKKSCDFNTSKYEE